MNHGLMRRFWSALSTAALERHPILILFFDFIPHFQHRITDLETDKQREWEGHHDDAPRDHGEEPAADPDAAVRLVG